MKENRFSKAARPTGIRLPSVSNRNYPAQTVDPPGIEPGSPACEAGIVPLDHRPSVAEVGVEPTIVHQALDLAALPDLRTRPLGPPIAVGGPRVAEAGIEPASDGL